MAAQTFGDLWRMVRLHASTAPMGLVREWTQQAYETLCERRPWVWLLKETRLVIPAARSLTVTFAASSQSITSAAGFATTDVGLQIRVGTFPFYTITEVLDASNAVLDVPYNGLTVGALTAQILGAYQTLPSDFGAFMLIIDPVVRRQIPWWYTQEELARIDPTRVTFGDLQRALIATTESPVPTTVGQARYEWWPSPTSAKQIPAWYRARPQVLADSDTFKGVLATRARVLEIGALARCALWPGTVEVKNPYFNAATAKSLADQFDRECANLELRDDDQQQQNWVALPYHRWPTWGLSGDTTTLRASDATLADYSPLW